MKRLSDYTQARVSLGLAGSSLPTAPLLEFRLAHARARDAVHLPLDSASFIQEMRQAGWEARELQSAAANREEYLRRPDKGRRLSEVAATELTRGGRSGGTVVIVADGLSALAVHRHAGPLLKEVMPGLGTQKLWVVRQGRVAIGDHIGQILGAELSVVIIGERPGLSTPDSLGVYMTWRPNLERTDAERNCISNIHALGLSYEMAAHKLLFLINEARRRQLSGVALKETAQAVISW